MKKTFLLLFVSLLSFGVYAQVDTEFWFACPDLTVKHDSQDKIYLNFVAYDQPATVTISQPAADPKTNPVYRENITVDANGFYTFSLGSFRTKVETIANGKVQNTGLYITSTVPITAYYSATGDNSEIYTLKGRNALGTSFTVPMQHSFPAAEDGYASIEIVASEDDTEVTVTTLVPTNISPTPGTFKLPVMKRGQTYAIRAADMNTTGLKHLQNTKITTNNKLIAVNSTDDSTLSPGGGKDLVGDQIVPESLAANKYIVVSDISAYEHAYFSALEPNTDIYIYDSKGEKLLTTLSPGQNFYVQLAENSATSFYTKDGTPFIVFQLTALDAEFGGTMLPNLDCSGSSEVSYKRVLGESKIDVTVLTRTENTGSFIVNGSARTINASMFQLVPGDPSWSYTTTSISGDQNVHIKNTKGVFHLGIFDAKQGTASYGYFSNFSNIPLQFSVDQSYYKEGDNIQFSLYNAAALENIKWTGPRGEFGVGESSPILSNVTVADAGMYVVNADHKDRCIVSPDTFYISIVPDLAVTKITACGGTEILLKASGKPDTNGKYEWTPAGLPETQEITVSPDADQEYTVKSYEQGIDRAENGNFTEGIRGFTSSYTYGGTAASALALPGTYTVGGIPKQYNPDYNEMSEHTGDGGNQLIAHVSAGESVIWEQTLTNLSLNTRYEFSAFFAAAKNNPTPLKLRFKINGVTSGIFVVQNNNEWNRFYFEWLSNATTATISIVTVASTPEGGAVCIDDIQFAPLLEISEKFQITIIESVEAEISGDDQICQGTATLTVEEEFDSYLWSTGATTKSITVTEAGNYSVTVKLGLCEGNDSFTVAPQPAVEFKLGDAPVMCSGDPDFSVPYTEVTGELGVAKITFDEKAIAANFQNDDDLLISDNLIRINLPGNVTPDRYSANLTLVDENCGSFNELPIEFTVRYSNEILTQRWNDVLGIKNTTYNGGYTFTEYQWYKNGSPIEGKTDSYIYEENYFKEGDSYSVLLTRDDGVEILTCDFYPEKLGDGKNMPTLVTPLQKVTLNDIESSGTAIIFNHLGQIDSSQSIDEQNPVVRMPAQKGFYILTINVDGKVKSHRILVK